jgi:4-amino-4-deoxy-L-arabinose transferase-like glycosyltransferase
MTVDSSKFIRHSVPILIGLLLLARGIGIALVPLMDSTEARYGEIGRKMAELNDWVTPWFDYGVPYWGKPPLAFWLTAVSIKLFGVNEFAARLPHLIVSLIIIAVVWGLSGRRDRDAAMPTVAVISGSFLYFVSAGAVITDIELTLGTSLAMSGFWLALEKSDASSGWSAALLFFGGLAVGLLAKGPLALVLAGTPRCSCGQHITAAGSTCGTACRGFLAWREHSRSHCHGTGSRNNARQAFLRIF